VRTRRAQPSWQRASHGVARAPVVAALTLLALCAATGRARADKLPLKLEASLGSPPRAIALEVRAQAASADTAAATVLQLGKTTTTLPVANASEASFQAVSLRGGAAVGVVRVEGPGGRVAGAVVTRDRKGRPAVLFAGALDLRGDPGERQGHVIEIADRDGDTLPDVLVARRTEAQRICGQERALLYPRAVDPTSLTLRPVSIGRVEKGMPPAVTLRATEASPGPTGPPTIHGLRIRAVSSEAGASETVLRAPPRSLTDGDGGSYWTEGRGGGGRGEFATFVFEGGGFPIRALAITPRPSTTPKNARLAYPTQLVLAGDDAAARILVELPDEPSPGTRYWVQPDKPLSWRCLSVVFEATKPVQGSGHSGFAVLGEVEAFTDLDFGEGLPTLVDRLGKGGKDGSAAADILASLPEERAAPALHDAWPRLPERGRKRALRVLAGFAKNSATARETLVLALDDEVADLRDRAIELLLASGEAGYETLLPRIASAQQQGDTIAVELARRSPERVVTRVLEALAAEAGSERPALREALALGARRGDTAVLDAVAAWVAQEKAPPIAARAAVALALAGVSEPPRARELAGQLLAASHTQAKEFADLWRLVATAALLPSEPGIDGWLTTLARKDERWMLRRAALEALSARAAKDFEPTALAALEDDYPRVRVSASKALAGRASAYDSLVQRVREDRWSMVRAAAVEATAGMPQGEALAREALGDRNQQVRTAAVNNLTRARARAAWPLIKARMVDEDEWPEVVGAAITYAQRLCVQDAAGPLLHVLKRGLKPSAWAPDQDVAALAFEALVALGGEAARAAYSAANSPLAPPGFKTAAEEAKKRAPLCAAERL